MVQRLLKAKSLTVSRHQLESLIIPAVLWLWILCAFWPGLRSGFHSNDFILIAEAQINQFDLSLFKVGPAKI
jgi:hypothetical protein